MVHQIGGRSLPLREKRGSRQMYDTKTSRPSFPLVSVGKIPGKFGPIPNQNTESRCNSTSFRYFFLAKLLVTIPSYVYYLDGFFGVGEGVGKPLFTKHPASPVHLHVPISTIESLLKPTPACSRNT